MIDIKDSFASILNLYKTDSKFPWNLETEIEYLEKSWNDIEKGRQQLTESQIKPLFKSAKTTVLNSGENYAHEFSYPEGSLTNFSESLDNQYKSYQFPLDDFQKRAILCIENDQNVLVSAHTSSGKTVVAEYAIAKCLAKKQRVIYTSPIKALSNQKFRDFYTQFKDVGIQTGDLIINQNASCVIMTTEILRNIVLRSSDVLKNVTWVIMDEVHYLRDQKRGYVWEELIIMVPDSIKFVFLSATIPNAREFSEWVSITRAEPCHFIQTDFRPVPLEHSLYCSNTNNIVPAFTHNGLCEESSIEQALGSMTISENRNILSNKNKQIKSSINNSTKKLFDSKLCPVIYFIFSRKQAEVLANCISTYNFNKSNEIEEVQKILNETLLKLSEDDRTISQIINIIPLLKKGIGIHHAGIIPILKEVTELLFSKGLIKFLFATETFALGLNMPARTVVFSSYFKTNKKNIVEMNANEYIQMSGRAGRRGKDQIGTSIIFSDDSLSKNMISGLIQGTPDPLKSAFRLTYATILNIIRKKVNVEFFLKNSFLQYQISKNIPSYNEIVNSLVKEYKTINVDDSQNYRDFVLQKLKKRKYLEIIKTFVREDYAIKGILKPGRIVKIENLGFGCVLSTGYQLKKIRGIKNKKNLMMIEVLYNKNKGSDSTTRIEPEIIQIALSKVDYFGFQLPSFNSLQSSGQKTILESIYSHKSAIKSSVNFNDPSIYNTERQHFKNYIENFKNAKKSFETNPIKEQIKENPEALDKLRINWKKGKILQEILIFKDKLKIAQKTVLLDQLNSRKKVLKSLGYLNYNESIEVRGEVAGGIETNEELVLVELFFDGFFNCLDEAGIFAALSCFIYEENAATPTSYLSSTNSKSYEKIKSTAEKISLISKQNQVEMDHEGFLSSFKCDMMETFYRWASGDKFRTICEKTAVQPGSIIRFLRRCFELLNELSQAAIKIGNTSLQRKFDSIITKIHRDIAFSESLYVVDIQKEFSEQ